MQDLANTVKHTYLERFNEMDLEYRLHFASRLAAWQNDIDAKKLLEVVKPEIVPASHEDRRTALHAIREELLHKDYERDVNNYQRRKPFFEKYPNLLLVHNALFRIRHWLCIYGVDERELLYELVPQESIEEMLASLQQDKEAVKTLSTYAVNSTYLYDKLYPARGLGLNLQDVLAVGASYNHEDAKDIQLLIYLYTHCILGETLFYHQAVTSNNEYYTQMLSEIEHVISDQFENINLDNKFEFLVCARICNFSTNIAQKIYEEANSSLQNGYLVDKFNKNINPVKQTFMMSEHRNVLFLMSLTKPIFLQN